VLDLAIGHGHPDRSAARREPVAAPGRLPLE
jgi:hypothetical protein